MSCDVRGRVAGCHPTYIDLACFGSVCVGSLIAELVLTSRMCALFPKHAKPINIFLPNPLRVRSIHRPPKQHHQSPLLHSTGLPSPLEASFQHTASGALLSQSTCLFKRLSKVYLRRDASKRHIGTHPLTRATGEIEIGVSGCAAIALGAQSAAPLGSRMVGLSRQNCLRAPPTICCTVKVFVF